MAKVYIGTSGFSYSHWGNGVFYPKGLPQRKWFEYYCQHFNSVELNVSFYRLPKKEIFAGWQKRAGKDFVFSIKGSRFITHVKKLKDCQEPVKTFFENADALKSGAKTQRDIVLWQLPPRLKANPEKLNQFLKILPKNFRHAFEFRDESWLGDEIYNRFAKTPLSQGVEVGKARFQAAPQIRSKAVESLDERKTPRFQCGEAYKILKKYNAAIVFQDYPEWPITEEATADFVYLRFHGNRRLYSSEYTEEELKKWSRKMDKWMNRGLDVYAYFNNDALGYAVPNAKRLKELVTRC